MTRTVSGRDVCVVIPVHDGATHLPGAIASVRAQTEAAGEVVVVDDGSTDGSADVAKTLGVRCIRQEQLGAGAARNTGIAAGDATVVAFLDCDDRWLPHKLARQLAAFATDPDLGWVSARGRVRIEAGAPPLPFAPHLVTGDELPGALGSTLLARRKVFDAIGGFDPGYAASEDFEWLRRSRDAGVRDLEIPEALAEIRFHGGNATYARRIQEEETLRALHESVLRRRAPRR